MLHYPKIPSSRKCPQTRCIAFEKYDGTNLHWDWDRDFGWHSFGTRRDAFNLTEAGVAQFTQAHENLSGCAAVFQETLALGLEQIFQQNPNYLAYPSLKVFTEFLGRESFAGLHKTDDTKELRLFDVWAEPFGMIGPKQFVTDFGHLNIARVVYEGKLTGQFAEDVRLDKYGTPEGVVCKGGAGGSDLWMCKIKTESYQVRLRQAFADKWEDYWE
ncbi:MAG: RNA ligase family protein [Capsulimonas sp.]|uniref:RNA ligase family protein n=1 Tax=Capsulimonas sp. TaxID=2494211 RepID=UPI00326408BA